VPWDIKIMLGFLPLKRLRETLIKEIPCDSSALYVFLGGNDGFPHHRYFSVFGVTLTNLFIPCNSVLKKLLVLDRNKVSNSRDRVPCDKLYDHHAYTFLESSCGQCSAHYPAKHVAPSQQH